MSITKIKPMGAILLGGGLLVLLWASAALVGGLHQVNWQVTELLRQMMVASGLVKPIHTLVGYYTHIKGIEYIICVAFFVAFPIFFRYVEKRKTGVPVTIKGKRVQ